MEQKLVLKVISSCHIGYQWNYYKNIFRIKKGYSTLLEHPFRI